MAWFARSLANSLKLDDDDDGGKEIHISATDAESVPIKQEKDEQRDSVDSSPSSSSEISSSRGVKEDLSEITKTLTRQLWGVASFLAPPPSHSPQISDSAGKESLADDSSDPDVADAAGIAGVRSDFAEIGGKFKTGISKLSSNIAVSEITKIATNLLQFGLEEQGSVDEYSAAGVIGVTDEVVSFARNIAMHPETWLDFPLLEDGDSDDFDMSDVQQEHALAVESLAPRLAALRIELCPGYMSERCFWKIYFVLLHPRLNKNDAELLSTPQIVEARAMLQQDSQNRMKAKPEPDLPGRGTSQSMEAADSPKEEHPSISPNAEFESVPLKTTALESATSTAAADFETEKHPILSSESQIIDKSVVQEEPVNQTILQCALSGSSSRALDDKYEDDGDEWLKEDNSEAVGISGTTIPIGNEEDVSFSDLEDDDDGDAPTSNRKVAYGSDSSTKESRDWVQLSGSSPESATDANSSTTRLAGAERPSARNPETKESNDWLDLEDIDVV
ncbi:uncharacterized protein LOC131153881 [Malania oleifera]|uniref:uncharacterized protein LOC131153881 n=1 Tax=Malania oleifera TaxID=397392 RepID=UPI0025AE039C|nr:uncharacterized protein LOC131153881 [Malania oleifera]